MEFVKSLPQLFFQSIQIDSAPIVVQSELLFVMSAIEKISIQIELDTIAIQLEL